MFWTESLGIFVLLTLCDVGNVMFRCIRPVALFATANSFGVFSDKSKGRFAQVEDEAWQSVNRRRQALMGFQATLRTFAYEIAHSYAQRGRKSRPRAVRV